MDRRVTILKLGGSVVTDKTRPFTVLPSVNDRISKEISEAEVSPLVIVHGGGSFGHPVAKEYAIAEGLRDPKQLCGYALTRQAMMVLNKIIIDALLAHNVNAVCFQPSAFMRTRRRRILSMDLRPLDHALKLGVVPVLHGDAVLDSHQGFAILSGDQIVAKLAIVEHARRIILATDVDGIYTSDPKRNSTAKLLTHVTLTELKRQLSTAKAESENFDVTGGIAGKLREMTAAVQRGVKIQVVNGRKAGWVLKALRGEELPSTILTKS